MSDVVATSYAVGNVLSSVALVLLNKRVFSAGFVYDWSESVQVGLNYTYIDFGRSPIQAQAALGTLEGDYDEFGAHAIALSVEF